jgi:hypothetical protein
MKVLVVSGVRPDRFASLCDARDGRIVQPSHEL